MHMSYLICDSLQFMQLLEFCLLFPSHMCGSCCRRSRASKVRLVSFGFETLEIQAQTFSLSLL